MQVSLTFSTPEELWEVQAATVIHVHPDLQVSQPQK